MFCLLPLFVVLASLDAPPSQAPSAATLAPRPLLHATAPEVVAPVAPLAPNWRVSACGGEIRGAGWWGERRKRFHELAVCGLAGANVTYLLLSGIAGPGAVMGLAVGIVGVIVCL